jgi:hypothetical protein
MVAGSPYLSLADVIEHAAIPHPALLNNCSI